MGDYPELSKRDADALGVANMTGRQLRARVFQVEGLMCELALSLDEMVNRFAPNDDGLGDAEVMVAERAREILTSIRERYDYHPDGETIDEPRLLRCVAALQDIANRWSDDDAHGLSHDPLTCEVVICVAKRALLSLSQA